jgi:hypothetical protein
MGTGPIRRPSDPAPLASSPSAHRRAAVAGGHLSRARAKAGRRHEREDRSKAGDFYTASTTADCLTAARAFHPPPDDAVEEAARCVDALRDRAGLPSPATQAPGPPGAVSRRPLPVENRPENRPRTGIARFSDPGEGNDAGRRLRTDAP